ncbi:MAG: hypothetical protein ACI4WT_08865 [Oligosphaeraceae bacterium]
MRNVSFAELRRCLDQKESLFVFRDETLLGNLNRVTGAAKAHLAAELFARVFLSGDHQGELAQAIERLLPGANALELFVGHLVGPRYDVAMLDADHLWLGDEAFSLRCQAAVRERFRLLLRTEGLIPLKETDGSGRARLLPFHFDEEGEAGVFDLKGRRHEEWSGHAARLGLAAQVTLHCEFDEALSLEGSSLMLPLQLAWWRHRGDLPAYDVFRVVATGRFDGQLRLAAVAVSEKATLVQSWERGLFLYPESAREVVQDRHVGCLVCGQPRDQLLPKLRRQTERFATLDTAYALSRLADVDAEVCTGNVTNWRHVTERLEPALKALDCHRHPEAQLTYAMLLNQAYCHLGDTQSAQKWNQRAQRLAKEHGDVYQRQLLRLHIDELVQLQDEERFAEVMVRQEALFRELEAFRDADLLMRFHGTMGQAHAYGTLQGLPGCSQEQAFRHFRQALDCAYHLNRPEDILQDTNYLHLYYALFQPGSDEEQEALEDALNRIDQEAADDAELRHRNLPFVRRAQAFAWYRCLLQGRRHPGVYQHLALMDRMVSMEEEAPDWIRCCIGKCVGACEAADGHPDEARRWFEAAIRAIPDGDSDQVKGLIRATACIQAWRSLGDDAFRQQALQLLDNLTKFPSALPFRDYLLGKSPDFPGLDYWY